MDMSAAALMPRAGHYDRKDEAHPLFPKYREHLASCRRLMIEASDFRDWLFQREAQSNRDAWAKHPRYPEFLSWMRATQAGARRSDPFPGNFQFWLKGGRW